MNSQNTEQHGAGSFLHSLSGGLILAIDNLFFGANALLAGAATPISSVLAFLTAFTAVYLVQRRRTNEKKQKSLLKALFSGIIAGIPTPIGGTILGTLVLLLSGTAAAEKVKNGKM